MSPLTTNPVVTYLNDALECLRLAASGDSFQIAAARYKVEEALRESGTPEEERRLPVGATCLKEVGATGRGLGVHPEWQPWFNRRGRLMGIAIVYLGADYGLELRPNGLSEDDRLIWCQKLCAILNRHGNVWACNICGGEVDLSRAIKPTAHVGPGGGSRG